MHNVQLLAIGKPGWAKIGLRTSNQGSGWYEKLYHVASIQEVTVLLCDLIALSQQRVRVSRLLTC
jgi:hypothetical protein